MSHVILSGGSRGIGAQIATVFAQEGNLVTFFYVSGISASDVLSRFPEELRDKLNPVRCDCSDSEAVNREVKKAVSKFGQPEILISNCGISISGLCTDYTYADYRKVMDTNFGALFNLTQNVVPYMVNNKHGSIIAISSMWGQTGASCESLYSASKGAVDAYVKSLAKELGPSGVRVNAISPGVIKTDMMNSYSESEVDELIEETPIMRIGTPMDIAKTALFLSGNEANFITGQIIGVNGGFLI